MDKTKDIQLLISNLVNFIENRFGVYLDTIMGYHKNLKSFQSIQIKAIQMCEIPMGKLDELPLIRGNGPPSADLEECRHLEIHRMTQGNFKKNNSPDGINYDFAIENCLTDIFNYWNGTKTALEIQTEKELDIFPIAHYMRALRNRLQHDLYDERKASGGSIRITRKITTYPFPSFEEGKNIQLSQKDIMAIVCEVREQCNTYLIPFLTGRLDDPPSKQQT